MQQTVRLLNDLGERYGTEHKYYNLRSPAEAIKLLCINNPEFQKELAFAHEHGIAYTLVQAGDFLGYKDLHLPLGQNDLVLAPVIAGSGGSIGKIVLGVALIAVAIAAPGAGFLGLGFAKTGVATSLLAAPSFALSSALAVAAGNLGIGLVLTGVAQLLAPQPVVPSLNTNNRTAPGENTNAVGPQGVSRATSGEQSYAFTGPANTVGVGATVPLVYGKLLIGSQLISSKIDVASESDPTGQFFLAPGADTIQVNGEKPRNKFAAHNGLRTRLWEYNQVRIENSESNGEYKRRKVEEVLKFTDTDSDTVRDLKNYDPDDNEFGNLQVFFELDKGLSRVIGGQTVPAFLTYEIAVKKDNYEGTSPIFAKVRGTIQGLLREKDDYKWCHAITYGQSGVEESDTTVRVIVRILDTDADTPGGRLVIRGAGYEHFYDRGENDTTRLVTET